MITRKTGVALSALTAMLLLSGGAQASSCTTSMLTAAGNSFDNSYTGASSSATIGACGYSLTVSAAITGDQLANQQSGTFSLNGNSVYLSTNAVNLKSIKSSNTLQMTVNGVEKFNGVINAATLPEMLSLTSLLTFNGNTVAVSTDIGSLTYSQLDAALSVNSHVYDNNNITISVNDVVVYSGRIGDLTAQTAANFLAALSAIDSATIVQQDIQRTATTVTSSIISRRVASVLRSAKFGGGTGKKDSDSGSSSRSGGKPSLSSSQPGMSMSGISSGDDGGNKGMWFSGGNTWLSSTDPFAPYKGTMKIAMVGIDAQPNPNLLVGVTVGLENTIVSTTFNQGELDVFGGTITPYAGYMFLDGALTIGAQVGYGAFWNESERISGITTVLGSYRTERVMANTDIDVYKNIGDSGLVLNGTVGALMVWDYRDTYSESDGTTPLKNDTVLGESKVGANLLFAINDSAQIFGGVTYLYDFLMDQDFDVQNNEDKDEFNVNLGMDILNDKGHSFTADVTQSLGRKDTKVLSFQVNYRMPF